MGEIPKYSEENLQGKYISLGKTWANNGIERVKETVHQVSHYIERRKRAKKVARIMLNTSKQRRK